MDLSWLLALTAGVGVAAACGLRAFLPLLFLGVAARLGVIHLRPGSEWLAADVALAALAVATVVEVAADKIPVVDHALDAIGTVKLSGWSWPETERRLKDTAFAVDEPEGDGHVIMIEGPVAFRLFWRGTERLLLNAITYGPALD